VPAWMPPAEREMWVDRMRARVQRQLRRARPTELDLERRARLLNRRHFGGRLRWNSIAYAPQQRLWGSCTFTAGVIRISDRCQRLPGWVLDYVLVHELAHLVHADHGHAFWGLVGRYPLAERARGYLLALDQVAGMSPSPLGGEG
jgi:Protein of unknown function DUF45